jgi:hypothetical protein
MTTPHPVKSTEDLEDYSALSHAGLEQGMGLFRRSAIFCLLSAISHALRDTPN